MTASSRPRRDQHLMDIVEPNFTKSKTDTEEPKCCRPKIEKEHPKRA